MLQNNINKKIYIGQSRNIEQRWMFHKRRLNSDTHKNLHLQSSWKKYGKDNFSMIILELCEPERLNELEIKWIKQLNSCNNQFGYNKTYGGGFGDIHPESRKKTIEKLRGQIISPEQREKISKTLTGRKRPKDDVSKTANSNRKLSDELELTICKLYIEEKIGSVKISRKLNLKETTVGSVINRLKKGTLIYEKDKNRLVWNV